MIRWSLTVAIVFLFCSFAFGDLQNIDVGQAQVFIRYDFVDRFNDSHSDNAIPPSAGSRENIGNKSLPGIFLHPGGLNDSILTYPGIEAAPNLSRAANTLEAPMFCFLVFHIGIRDYIDWETERPSKPNGVRFAVHINGERVFEEELARSEWRPRAIDLAPWVGKSLDIEFRTNAIDGNSSYDWALFGRPMIVMLRPKNLDDFNDTENGLALQKVQCQTDAHFVLRMGDANLEARLPEGIHWLPLEFDLVASAALEIKEGHAVLGEILAAPYAAEVRVLTRALSTPLLTVGRPFRLVQQVKNTGLGGMDQPRSSGFVFAPFKEDGTFDPGKDIETVPLPVLAPGESVWTASETLLPEIPGAWHIGAEVYVFPESPETPEDRPGGVQIAVYEDGPLRAIAGNAWSRLALVVDAGRGYAIAETWNGASWQRAGSLYPLFEVTAAGDQPGTSREIRFRIDDVRTDGERLVIEAGSPDWPGSTLRLSFGPDPEKARISIESELNPGSDLPLRAFRGPALLAGDRAFGVHKDFAIFPGLEYLEGDEESSSERDLAYPLSDRRVPALHKITAPLLAIQGEGALAALVWDIAQEWAPGERYPAARFHAPNEATGMEHIHASIFAPSMGKYVEENEYFASHPYPAKAGEALRLSSWLVLDHESNYPGDSIVHGPHRGGLALQAFTHYFDLFGFPSPSSQPRSFDAQNRLNARGYLDAVGDADPPAWKHCHGWAPGLYTGQNTPVMLLARHVEDAGLAAALEERAHLVTERAIRERGPHYLWTNAACHIMMGEWPFIAGFTAESMRDFRRTGWNALKSREDGLWVWRPAGQQYESLGVSGDHTLGQAAQPSFMALRAARLSGDPELADAALDAMQQMTRYDVPRGAQMWECPLYQPDILASAMAIRAYCEAYRLTGDPAHLDRARYWAWAGMPFLYFWELEGYPTMRYNVIAVIGSTFHTHSWLGLPVVWCGLVYAYALQDFAQYDTTFDWLAIAQGITTSAMWQQYTEGPNAGTYPDSWNMVQNRPVPADIGPENIVVNEFRLRGFSPEIRFEKTRVGERPVLINSANEIVRVAQGDAGKTLTVSLTEGPFGRGYTIVSSVARPAAVEGGGEAQTDSAALRGQDEGWLYDEDLEAVVLKSGTADVVLRW